LTIHISSQSDPLDVLGKLHSAELCDFLGVLLLFVTLESSKPSKLSNGLLRLLMGSPACERFSAEEISGID
jgi:hypothetical protein